MNGVSWTFGERLFLVMVCEAFLIFFTTLIWIDLKEGGQDSWAVKHPKLFRAIFWLAKFLLVVGAIVSLIYGGYPFSSWPSQTVVWISDWRNWVLLCVALAFAVDEIRTISGLGVLLFWVGVVAFSYFFGQLSSLSSLLVLVILMVLFSFWFCAFETAITRLEGVWSARPPNDPIRRWYSVKTRQKADGKISPQYHMIASVTFGFCKRYLNDSGLSCASLLALVALVDIGGTIRLGEFVIAKTPIPDYVLGTAIITIPVVILGDLFGTMIGMRRPVMILLCTAILMWIFYFPMSLVMRRISDRAMRVANKFKFDDGYEVKPPPVSGA